jgi:hypothetical protein
MIGFQSNVFSKAVYSVHVHFFRRRSILSDNVILRCTLEVGLGESGVKSSTSGSIDWKEDGIVSPLLR